MQRIKIPIRPGGMLADKSVNDLGYDQHETIKNWKEVKEGEWEIVKGFINSTTGLTAMKSAAEVTDDLSGDRFKILQDGIGLKRIDYDNSNSPLTGYENETPSDISLPSGVTIGDSAVCRFFVHNGIVRITGTSEPVWYGYIDRTLFQNSWSTLDLDDFNSGVDGWAGSNATVVQEAVSPLLEGAGTLQIDATATDGYAYKSFTVTSGTKYKFFIKGLKATAQTTETFKVIIGTTQGGSEITFITKTITTGVPLEDDWLVFEYEFTATTTTIYIGLSPIGNGDVVHFDYSLLRENHQIVIAGWYIFKAQLAKPTDAEITDIDVYRFGSAVNTVGTVVALAGFGLGYDESQYSLLADDISMDDVLGFTFDVPDYDNALGGGTLGVIKFDVTIPHDLDKYRLTSVLVSLLYSIGEQGIINFATHDYNVHQELDFTEEYEDGWIFTKSNFHTDVANPKRLELTDAGDDNLRWWDGLFKVGQRIRISGNRISGELRVVDTIITNIYNEYTDTDADTWIEILDDVDQLGGHGDLPIMGIWVEKIWEFTAGVGYTSRMALEVEGAGLGTHPDFTGIPAGTEENTPDYTHHLALEKIAFCLSAEDEEQDIIRYSPLSQYDNFPEGLVIQTPVGDIDRNLALVERDGRFVTLKRKSVAQGQFTSSTYFHDKDGVAHGLYATEGYIVVDDVLYFMDIDDIYMFNGVQVQPFMQNSLMRSLYVANVHTGSFFAYKPLDKELWLVLNGIIIVYDFERRNFYLRETDLTPVHGFTDYDQRLFLYSSSKFALYNHDQPYFDESMQAYFKTRLVDLKNPENYKFCHKILMRMKSNTNFTMRITDDNEGKYAEATGEPESDILGPIVFKPRYLFKEAYIEYTTSGLPSNLTGTIKSCDLIVSRWKGIK